MSLSVNLILPHEQRTGSKVNAKTMLKIFIASVPLVVVVLVLQQAVSFYVLQTNLRIQESRWESAEPRQAFARRQLSRMNANTQIKAEMEGWQKSTAFWDSVLLALIESVPENIQIITLRLQAGAAPNMPDGGSPPIRRPTLLIEGRVSEPDAMPNILQLKNALREHAHTQDAIEVAEVINFAAASAQSAERLRVFSIRIQFHDLPRDQSSS